MGGGEGTKQGTEERIQMVGMNPLWGRIADNAPLYLVAEANSYRFVIDSCNECRICSSCIPLSLSFSLTLSLFHALLLFLSLFDKQPYATGLANGGLSGERITSSNHFVTGHAPSRRYQIALLDSAPCNPCASCFVVA